MPSLLVDFKRLTDELLGEINEMILSYNHPDVEIRPGGSGTSRDCRDIEVDKNSRMLLLDVTSHILHFSQDIKYDGSGLY